ncbi:redox-sensitive transcriptional activator SoxR [Undibacterium sp. SXout11W]|uniref:redox-sensitive transcriptional activator SoxR n=1 Tax=Undibacterium sp. SXout11W TaxID=3413050 RepID=UPI003BF3DCCF
MSDLISIGELAKRAGINASAIRFYEERGLLESVTAAGQRRHFKKDSLRRIAFIRAAQNAGLRLEEIEVTLKQLPDQRTPNKADWQKLSSAWQPLLQQRIDALIALRDQLTSCIGCGCLSLKSCALYNPQDQVSSKGAGARFLLGDHPDK